MNKALNNTNKPMEKRMFKNMIVFMGIIIACTSNASQKPHDFSAKQTAEQSLSLREKISICTKALSYFEQEKQSLEKEILAIKEHHRAVEIPKNLFSDYTKIDPYVSSLSCVLKFNIHRHREQIRSTNDALYRELQEVESSSDFTPAKVTAIQNSCNAFRNALALRASTFEKDLLACTENIRHTSSLLSQLNAQSTASAAASNAATSQDSLESETYILNLQVYCATTDYEREQKLADTLMIAAFEEFSWPCTAKRANAVIEKLEKQRKYEASAKQEVERAKAMSLNAQSKNTTQSAATAAAPASAQAKK